MDVITVGIITFQRSHNYGAVLQAYALLSTIKGLGYRAELIDYWPKYRDGHYNLVYFPLKSFFRNGASNFNAKDTIKEILTFPPRYKQSQKFKSFIKNYLNVTTHPYRSGADIPDKYDVIVCGSDQIWRYHFRGNEGFDDVYFAKYPSNKTVIKISYSASMGDNDINEKAKKQLSELLENFDFISVREDSLLKLITPLTTRLPSAVLDPVFLLSADEWRRMIKKNSRKKKYLLFYQLLLNHEAEKLVKKIAKEKQLEIIHIGGVKRNTNPFGSQKLKLSTGPLDFISLIAHADYVVSTSYHGVVFAIRFGKPFLALGFKDNFYRIRSLLKSLGIENRLVDQNSDAYIDVIDYTPVNIKLKKLKEDSLSFIIQSLNTAGKD
ncbi:MAG: polysaccharide pyruvyl transferase family protein [Ginsengibacter sp.]